MPHKSTLPTKTCPVCQRDFSWRKKWQRDWDQVKFCSDACRKGTPRGAVLPAVPKRRQAGAQRSAPQRPLLKDPPNAPANRRPPCSVP